MIWLVWEANGRTPDAFANEDDANEFRSRRQTQVRHTVYIRQVAVKGEAK